MKFCELYKIVNHIERILRYREPKEIVVEDNTILMKCKNGTPTNIYRGDENNITQVLDALKVIEELVPLINNIKF